MRKTLITALALTAATAAFCLPDARPAEAAIYYPWCARYGGELGGGSNCYFSTRAQCAAAISGVGGVCEPNLFYDAYGPGQAPDYVAQSGKRKRMRHHY